MSKRRTDENTTTRIACVRERFSPLSSDDGAAFTPALFATLEQHRAARPGHAAVAVIAAWHDQEGRRRHATRVVFHEPGAVDPIAVSFGRHTCCDVPGLPGASLRHALLLLWPAGPGEAPRMEAIDLHTGIGLSVGDGTAATRIEGMGAVRFGVGAAEVLVLPAAVDVALVPQGASALMNDLQPAPVRARLSQDDLAPVPVVSTSVLWATRSEPTPAIMAKDALRDTPTSLFRRPELHLAPSSEQTVYVRVQPEDTVDGVLLGRYPRCHGADLFRTESVSRVHAFLFVRRGRTWIIDVGSTNGTFVVDAAGEERVELGDGRRVARVEDGERVRLSGTDVVLLVEGETPNVPFGGVA